ncbi:MAG TPA: glycosyltransferase family 4 protein [Acidimicrobiales bacterium]
MVDLQDAHHAEATLRAPARALSVVAPPTSPEAAGRTPSPEAADRTSGIRASVLIIVQNLPVPFDRRVWLECRALRDAGYHVSVVCPRGPGDPAEETVEGVTLYKYRPARGGNGTLAFLREYAYSFVATAWLCAKAWRRERFDVLQACNPPDIFWPLALLARLRGVTFVFDHHDLCPELFESRFPGGGRAALWGLRALEWCTYRSARHVIATNDSYRDVALRRGGKRHHEVTVVRTGPDPDQLRAVPPLPELRRGRAHLVAYLGVMGPQDGVDLALRAAAHVVHVLHRQDIAFTLMGSGDCLPELTALRDELGLGDVVEFTGRVPDGTVAQVLSTADVALCPDPKNPLNDLSTMNKTMEYMTFSLPVVAFDLRETRVSAGDAAVYAAPNDVADYACRIVDLVDDPARRKAMGRIGRARILEVLSWPHQRDEYLGVYGALTAPPSLGRSRKDKEVVVRPGLAG